MSFKKARFNREKLFPEPTPYEIIDYSYFPNFSFNMTQVLNKVWKNINKKTKTIKRK